MSFEFLKRRQQLQLKSCSDEELKFINVLFPSHTCNPTEQVECSNLCIFN